MPANDTMGQQMKSKKQGKMSAALVDFWANSASASVERDCRDGAVVTLSKRTHNRALSEMLSEARAKRATAAEIERLEAEERALHAEIDAAYWRFSRSSSSHLHLAPHATYVRYNEVRTRLSILRSQRES